jgi:hypothetical protein
MTTNFAKNKETEKGDQSFFIYYGDKYYSFGEGFRVAKITDNERIIDCGYGVDISEYPNVYFNYIDNSYIKKDEAEAEADKLNDELSAARQEDGDGDGDEDKEAEFWKKIGV